MIRPARSDDPTLSDDDFAKLMEPAEEAIINHVNNNVVYDFFAFFIATSYDLDCLWSDSCLEYEYTDARCHLANIPDFKDIDLKKLNKILLEKYKMKVTNENPLKIEKIQ